MASKISLTASPPDCIMALGSKVPVAFGRIASNPFSFAHAVHSARLQPPLPALVLKLKSIIFPL
ncbi:hypothetical protein F4Z99_20030 [Candidatus Poribacteria bacterium]|nr:hypothetical protein [Candidatus Poribacteria bacterium]